MRRLSKARVFKVICQVPLSGVTAHRLFNCNSRFVAVLTSLARAAAHTDAQESARRTYTQKFTMHSHLYNTDMPTRKRRARGHFSCFESTRECLMPLGQLLLGKYKRRSASALQTNKEKYFSCSICNFTQLFCQNTLQARAPPLAARNCSVLGIIGEQ